MCVLDFNLGRGPRQWRAVRFDQLLRCQPGNVDGMLLVYARVGRGIAETNARDEACQNQQLVYSASESPATL